MNLLLRSTRIIAKTSLKTVCIPPLSGGKKFRPCGPKCICLMYLDLKDFKSQNYYEQCFRTRMKN